YIQRKIELFSLALTQSLLQQTLRTRGDARPRAPKSARWIGAMVLREFYRNPDCMIFTQPMRLAKA
ncbi:MAG: hypothetical protein WB048_03525, partial [Pseudolabrys sp.]